MKRNSNDRSHETSVNISSSFRILPCMRTCEVEQFHFETHLPRLPEYYNLMKTSVCYNSMKFCWYFCRVTEKRVKSLNIAFKEVNKQFQTSCNSVLNSVIVSMYVKYYALVTQGLTRLLLVPFNKEHFMMHFLGLTFLFTLIFFSVRVLSKKFQCNTHLINSKIVFMPSRKYNILKAYSLISSLCSKQIKTINTLQDLRFSRQ